jgi:hypothetical protein
MGPPLGDGPPLGRPRTRWLLVKPWENTREKEASGTRRVALAQKDSLCGDETFPVSSGIWRVESKLQFTEAAGVPRASDGAGPGGGRSDAADIPRASAR